MGETVIFMGEGDWKTNKLHSNKVRMVRNALNKTRYTYCRSPAMKLYLTLNNT